MILAHLSDAHIGPLPRPTRRELAGKRLTGYINWQRGRGRQHDMGVLTDLVADMLATKPDHVAMTGDILNLGLPAEFPVAAAWLQTLGPVERVSFVPGNHDVYTRGAAAHVAETFGPWTVGDGGAKPNNFPYLQVRGGVALIGLESGVPTAPFLASGRLGGAQCARLIDVLAKTKRENVPRVVMVHHPPHVKGAGFGRGLTDARAFERIIRQYGADLVIHGHNHGQSVAYLDGPDGKVPVVGVPSCSAVPGTFGHRAAYHLFDIRPGEPVRCQARGLREDRRTIGDLGPLTL